MKPHAAPAAIPAKIITGIKIQAEVSAGSRGHNTTALAPHAPMMNCPSAPMFHNFMRNATEQASAVNRMGVALTIVSDNTPMSPKDAAAICAYDFQASPPASSMTIPPKINARMIAPIEIAAGYQPGGSFSRGSSRIRNPVRRFCTEADSAMSHSFFADLVQRCARHHQSNCFDQTLIGFNGFDLDLTHNLPLIDDVDAITQRQQFFQFLR